jgi:hypothetical protein
MCVCVCSVSDKPRRPKLHQTHNTTHTGADLSSVCSYRANQKLLLNYCAFYYYHVNVASFLNILYLFGQHRPCYASQSLLVQSTRTQHKNSLLLFFNCYYIFRSYIQGDRRESDGFKKKVLGRFSTWNGFIFTKLMVKAYHFSYVFKYEK